MKKILYFSIILIVSNFALAAPFVVSDSTTQVVTHCGVVLDSGSKIDVPVVTATPTTAICKYDISAVSVGPHTIKATFVNIDPIWGRSESVFSSPLDFVRPSNVINIAPTNLVITK